MAVTILGIEIDQVTFDSALEQIESFIGQRGAHQIVTVNPEFIMRAQTDRAFRKVLNDADLALPDGAGLLWASRLLKQSQSSIALRPRKLTHLPERVTGTDLVPALAQRATVRGWKIYLLGGRPGVASRAASYLKEELPDLKIVGAESGPLITDGGKPLNHDQETLLKAVLARIQHAKPDMLFVAFGAPKQDRFIARYSKELNVPVMIGVGGAFDFLAGSVQRAPTLFKVLWLEWLWRVVVEPWRIGRILTAVVHFPLTFLFGQLWSKK